MRSGERSCGEAPIYCCRSACMAAFINSRIASGRADNPPAPSCSNRLSSSWSLNVKVKGNGAFEDNEGETGMVNSSWQAMGNVLLSCRKQPKEYTQACRFPPTAAKSIYRKKITLTLLPLYEAVVNAIQ